MTPCFVLRSDQFSFMGSIVAVCGCETNELSVTALKYPPEVLTALLITTQSEQLMRIMVHRVTNLLQNIE